MSLKQVRKDWNVTHCNRISSANKKISLICKYMKIVINDDKKGETLELDRVEKQYEIEFSNIRTVSR